MHAQTKLLLGLRSLIINTHVQPHSKEYPMQNRRAVMVWWVFWGGWGVIKKCWMFHCFLQFLLYVVFKLAHFTLVRKSKACQWLLPEQLSKPVASGREGAMLEAIMLLPAVAWVSWWLPTRIQLPKQLLLLRMPSTQLGWSTSCTRSSARLHYCALLFSSTKHAKPTIISHSSDLHLIWEAALCFLWCF